MIKKILISFLPIALMAFTSSYMVETGMPGRSGAPGEGTCIQCHGGAPLNSGTGSITIQSPSMTGNHYTPGQTYHMSVTISLATCNLFGIDIVALNYLNDNAGTLIITDTLSTHIIDATVNSVVRHNIVHTNNGGLSSGSKIFSFDWTAPPAGTGNVTFYFCGLAVDQAGYFVYSSSQVYTDVNCVALAQQPGAISGDPFLCIGDSATYSISPVAGSPVYVWSFPPDWTGSASGNMLNVVADYYPGEISVTVNNSCGGGPASTMQVNSSVINAYPNPSRVSCNGASDGSVNVVPYGGIFPYTYSWSNGNTTDAVSNLSGGTYTVTVTDSVGCSVSNSANVFEPLVLSATISSVNPGCYGNSNGYASVNVSGGSPSYQYIWSQSGLNSPSIYNLTAGTYSVTVTDGYNCISTSSVILTEPALLTATTTHTDLICYGETNGNATVSVSGGTPSYTYYWFPFGGNSASANNLTAGSYTVTVYDAHSCTTSSIVAITQPLQINIGLTTADDLCNNSGGTATAFPSGGTGSYLYSWSTIPVQHNAAASNIPFGSYVVTVTDANGCTGTTNAIINHPPLLIADAGTGFDICAGSSLPLGGNPTSAGGVPPYTYNWSPASGLNSVLIPGPVASPVTSTIYTVSVTDVNGCIAVSTVNINVNPLPVATISSNGDTLFSTPAQVYQWDSAHAPIAGANSFFYVPLHNGVYSLVVADSHGCVDTSADFSFTTLELNTVDSKYLFSVFPNPATDYLVIYTKENLPDVPVKIFDDYGKCVFEKMLNAGNNTIDTREFSGGFYSVVFGSDEANYLKRIFISR